jgi:hypothetical protein
MKLMKLILAITIAPVLYKFDDEYGKRHLGLLSFVLGSMVLTSSKLQRGIGWAGLKYLSATTGEVSVV